MSLAVVDDYRESVFPPFEGLVVDGLRAKISSASVDVGATHHHIDQVARLVITGQVVRIDHVVDHRSGRLVRVETFKILDASEMS